MEKLIQEYDADSSGDLDLLELTKLLSKLAVESGKGASETEVSWILKAAGKQRQNIIDINELKFVLQLWGTYVRTRAKVESLFEKYDTRRRQSLDFDQLKRYFSDLDGYPPKKNSEVRAIMHEVNGVDGLNLVQLALATSLWCCPTLH
eukprot:CAMPEP_0172192714 /NCGR_PEP_ID=MMETSP1050-20130122/24501_1 /TAXON_ID=233186 /ORGANISM="Cryptomonas curvata, Strain CCAP979/52" /LENGTH=147 /DNA_ID=CAMNT_0012868087 /DNA_START=100 /DNA_END=540 /DNA_ORIENTATION=+